LFDAKERHELLDGIGFLEFLEGRASGPPSEDDFGLRIFWASSTKLVILSMAELIWNCVPVFTRRLHHFRSPAGSHQLKLTIFHAAALGRNLRYPSWPLSDGTTSSSPTKSTKITIKHFSSQSPRVES
jgi:hypothetical protein